MSGEMNFDPDEPEFADAGICACGEEAGIGWCPMGRDAGCWQCSDDCECDCHASEPDANAALVGGDAEGLADAIASLRPKEAPMPEVDSEAPLTKRPGETQTEFAIRCVRAGAWDEGYLRGTLDATSDLDPADNPYRVTSPEGGTP